MLRTSAPRTVRRVLAIALSLAITAIGQRWVGTYSIYAVELQDERDRMHKAILYNQLPDSISSWSSIGANGLNARRLTVWLAEALHRTTAISVQRVYVIIESAALLACCLLLYAFLESYTGWQFAIASLLYWGCVLPLTYLHHHFHPWDRPSVAMWLLALILTRKRSWLLLSAVLLVGVATKYDLLVFPLLVFLIDWKSEPLKANLLRAGLLLALTVSAFVVLRLGAPNGFEPRPVLSQISANLQVFRESWYAYPPLLALGLPAVFAAIGYPVADRFARACALFAIVVTAILFLQTNFVEFRAEVPILILLLPAAWHGLTRSTSSRLEVVS